VKVSPRVPGLKKEKDLSYGIRGGPPEANVLKDLI